MKKYLLGAALLGVLAITATGASAAVVCNDEGDCWKVKDKYDYPPAAHLQIYGDDWKWEGNKDRLLSSALQGVIGRPATRGGPLMRHVRIPWSWDFNNASPKHRVGVACLREE
jgi:hypothetical protein